MSNSTYQGDVSTELLNGKIVAMSPRPTVNHDIVARNIHRIFGDYLRRKKCMLFGEVDVYLTEKDRVVPDAMIVCNKEIVKKNGIYGTPDLMVEILSPSTATKDKGYKNNLYEQCGVKEYWLVDTDSRSIEVHLLLNGRYALDQVYCVFPDYLIEKMTEEENRGIIYAFKTTLFADLIVVIDEVFENML